MLAFFGTGCLLSEHHSLAQDRVQRPLLPCGAEAHMAARWTLWLIRGSLRLFAPRCFLSFRLRTTSRNTSSDIGTRSCEIVRGGGGGRPGARALTRLCRVLPEALAAPGAPKPRDWLIEANPCGGNWLPASFPRLANRSSITMSLTIFFQSVFSCFFPCQSRNQCPILLFCPHTPLPKPCLGQGYRLIGTRQQIVPCFLHNLHHTSLTMGHPS